jgi:hypothetical protein
MDEELDRRFDALMRRINDSHEAMLIGLRGLQTSTDAMQTDMRSIKAEQAALRTYMGARAAETEGLITRLFDRLNDRLDQSERSIEERLRKLEGPQE